MAETKVRMTVTEALSKINLTQKKIADKRSAFPQYISRPEMMKDPLETEGGSEKYITEQRQAIRDLEAYLIALRVAVAESNAQTSLSVGGSTRPVSEWLIWKRDIAAGFRQELQSILSAVSSERQRYSRQVKDNVELTICVSETEIQKEVELYSMMWEDLDGQLSLKNATTFVEL